MAGGTTQRRFGIRAAILCKIVVVAQCCRGKRGVLRLRRALAAPEDARQTANERTGAWRGALAQSLQKRRRRHCVARLFYRLSGSEDVAAGEWDRFRFLALRGVERVFLGAHPAARLALPAALAAARLGS